MTKTFKMKYYDYDCDFRIYGIDNRLGFCNSEFISHFPDIVNHKLFSLVVSETRQHKKGEIKVHILNRHGIVRIGNKHHQLLQRTVEGMNAAFGCDTMDNKTFYVHVRNLWL